MAYLNQDDENKQGQDATTGGAYIGQSTGTGPTTKVETPSSSGNYTNLQNYIGANQGADAQMGQAVQGMVNKAGQTFDKAANDWEQAGVSQIKGGTAKVDPTTMKSITSGTGPASVDASYKGPASINDIKGTAPNQADLTNLGNMVKQSSGSMSDVGTLLRGTDYGKNAGYTSGENNLDSFITQNGAAGQQALGQIGQDWGGESQKYQGIQNSLTGGISQAQGKSKDTQRQYDSAIKNEDDRVKSALAGVTTSSADVAGPTPQQLQQQKQQQWNLQHTISAFETPRGTAGSNIDFNGGSNTFNPTNPTTEQGPLTNTPVGPYTAPNGSENETKANPILNQVVKPISNAVSGWGLSHGGKVPDENELYRGIRGMIGR